MAEVLFKQKMIEMWKKDKRLKPFDLYFHWKTGEVKNLLSNRDVFRQMRKDSKRMLHELIDNETYEVKDEELYQVVDAIDEELINISMIWGIC